MENTYTITLYYYNRSSNGIYTKTQLLKEAGKSQAENHLQM